MTYFSWSSGRTNADDRIDCFLTPAAVVTRTFCTRHIVWKQIITFCSQTKAEKLRCRREAARRLMSVNISQSHSRSLKIIQNVQFSSYVTLNNILTLKSRLEVTQGLYCIVRLLKILFGQNEMHYGGRYRLEFTPGCDFGHVISVMRSSTAAHKMWRKSDNVRPTHSFLLSNMASIRHLGFSAKWHFTIQIQFSIWCQILVQKSCSWIEIWPKMKSNMAAAGVLNVLSVEVLVTWHTWVAFTAAWQIWHQSDWSARDTV